MTGMEQGDLKWGRRRTGRGGETVQTGGVKEPGRESDIQTGFHPKDELSACM
jgi:hypothetical protein